MTALKPASTPRFWWPALRAGVFMGWEEQFNWIRDPLLLAVYMFIRPLATVALVVVMYGLATHGAWQEPLFAYIYLGNTLYIYVGYAFQATAWSVIDEREHYRTLKYLALSPASLLWYLLGRTLAPLLLGSISVWVGLMAGAAFFHLPLRWEVMVLPRLVGGLAVGWTGMMAIGFFLAGVTLNARRYFWALGEAVAGTLYVATGAIFPITVLPRALQYVAYGLPITYWLEYMRRVLLAEGVPTAPPWTQWTNADLMRVLLPLTALYLAASLAFFRYAEKRARREDMLEATSDF